jgi:hypothetical protein
MMLLSPNALLPLLVCLLLFVLVIVEYDDDRNIERTDQIYA